jgi:peptide/nickel transport system permease protein
MRPSTRRSGSSDVRRVKLNATGIVGLSILVVVVLSALLAPVVAPHDPNRQNLLARNAPPAWIEGGSTAHLVGTDRLGRDILSRIVHGSRVSLVTALLAVAGSAVLGTTLGLVAGYAGAWVQNVIMRLVDIMLAIPFILLALVIITVLGSSLLNLVFTFVVVRWVQFARIAFANTLEVKERDYVIAARASGASDGRIVSRYILPNILSPLLVIATLELGFVILLESGLSFLGLGVPPEIPSWGSMLQEGRALINIAWWLTAFPGLAIALTVMGFNFTGDWLRDALDPHL